MYDAVLSCIHRIHQLKTLPMDHEPSREDLWDFVLKMDDVLRLAAVNHPDFKKQILSVLGDWDKSDLIDCCVEGGVDANSWVDTFAEQVGPLEEYEPVKGGCDG